MQRASASGAAGTRQRTTVSIDVTGDDDDNREARKRNAAAAGSGARSADSPESNSGEAVVSFGQIHRTHTQRQSSAENAGALSSHPRIDREIQRLCRHYEKNTDALNLLRGRDASTTESAAAIARLQKKRRVLTARLQECMGLLEPNLPGTVTARAKSAATVKLEATFNNVWEDYQQTQRNSCTKYLWTLLSGGIAYSIPFGTATMLARGLKIPYLVLLAGPLHTLAEPVWAMVRATTWTNPASEAYVGRQRARARANGDAWRYLAHIKPKAKMVWTDPKTGKHSLLTAAQALATNQELWLWMHKVLSDDLPFFVFSALYAGKNGVAEWQGPQFYDHRAPNGRRNDLLIQFAAGFLSGALSMLLAQGLRRLISGATNGQELVGKSLHVWELEARYLKSYAQDLDDMLAMSNLSRDDARQLRAQLRKVRDQRAKAHAKSSLLTSVGHELGVMFQKKRLASGSDPDMPGKRLDTACSILGKTTSLLPSLAVTVWLQPWARSAIPSERWIAHVVPPLSLVCWPGFAMRTEFQDWWRSLYGAGKGMLSAMRAGCCCAPDDEADAAGASEADDSSSDSELSDIDGDSGTEGRKNDHVVDMQAVAHAHGGLSASSARIDPSTTSSSGSSSDSGSGSADSADAHSPSSSVCVTQSSGSSGQSDPTGQRVREDAGCSTTASHAQSKSDEASA
jgi:hypothetical protein